MYRSCRGHWLRGSCGCTGGGIWENYVPSAKFFCEPKSALKCWNLKFISNNYLKITRRKKMLYINPKCEREIDACDQRKDGFEHMCIWNICAVKMSSAFIHPPTKSSPMVEELLLWLDFRIGTEPCLSFNEVTVYTWSHINTSSTCFQPHFILYVIYVYVYVYVCIYGFPGCTSGKELLCQCRRGKRCRLDPWVRKIPWRVPWTEKPGGLWSTGS